MSDHFTSTPLSPRQIDQAFALLQVSLSGVALEDWRRYAQRLIACQGDRAGILTVQSGGYLYGLFSYRVDPDGPSGRRLRVDTFLVLDLPLGAAPTAELVAAVNRLAAALGCLTIQLTLRTSHPTKPRFWHRLVAHFQAHGYVVEGPPVCKTPTQPAPLASPRPANDNPRSPPALMPRDAPAAEVGLLPRSFDERR